MDAINKFSWFRPAVSAEQQETQTTSQEVAAPISNAGIGNTPDAFETFQPKTLDLPHLTTPTTAGDPRNSTANSTPQGETVEFSSFFDLLTTDQEQAEGLKMPVSGTPDLEGLTKPMNDGEANTRFSASYLLPPRVSDTLVKAAEVAAFLNRISQFTGKSAEELQALFKKYGLKPGELPYPPDEKIIAFLKDSAFASQNEVSLLWALYNGFKDVKPPAHEDPKFNGPVVYAPLIGLLIPAVRKIREAAAAQALYRKISEFTGKSPTEVQELFNQYHLKPSSLPNPPDYNVYQFLQDPAFAGISPALLLYEIYGW